MQSFYTGWFKKTNEIYFLLNIHISMHVTNGREFCVSVSELLFGTALEDLNFLWNFQVRREISMFPILSLIENTWYLISHPQYAQNYTRSDVLFLEVDENSWIFIIWILHPGGTHVSTKDLN